MTPKYKAWDKETELMNDVTVIDFENEGVYYKHWRYGHSEAVSFKDVELLQSTGLLDKNGKEIFIGDIVDVRTLEGTIYLRGIVKKVKGGFYIEGLYHSKIIPLTDFYFKSYTNTLEIEILGNKFEDGYLLERY